MNVRPTEKVPRLVVWYGYAIFYSGVLCFPLAVVLGVRSYLTDGDNIFSSALTVVDGWGLAVGLCVFGIAVSHGDRVVLIVLLVLTVFVCGLAGFLFTLGRNPEVGHYLWLAGGLISSPLVLILIAYWKKLP